MNQQLGKIPILALLIALSICQQELQADDIQSAKSEANIGLELLEHDKWEEAQKHFDLALKLDQSFAWGYFGRGRIFLKKGNVDKALDDFDHAIKFDPRLQLAYRERGYVWLMKGDSQRAMSDLNRAIEIDPTDPSFFVIRGEIWSTQKEWGKAIKEYSTAVSLSDGSDKLCYLTLRGNARMLETVSKPV